MKTILDFRTLFHNKRIVIGITATAASYKALELIRLFQKAGAKVSAMITTNGATLIGKPLLQSITGGSVLSDPDDTMQHVYWAKADLIVIAGATANTCAALAQGLANNTLTSTCLAADPKKVVICPSMNVQMWEHSATQRNIKNLQSDGYTICPPEIGEQACGDYGAGRLADMQTILLYSSKAITPQILKNKTIAINGGGTSAPIDPVRLISNRSSGVMSITLAYTLWSMGATVKLLLGESIFDSDELPSVISIAPDLKTPEMMFDASLSASKECDVFIACCAVLDCTPEVQSNKKIKKLNQQMTLPLKATKDILATIGNSDKRPNMLIGFAAETNDMVDYGIKKLIEKKADVIISNKVGDRNCGFASEASKAYILSKNTTFSTELISKTNLSFLIGQIISTHLHSLRAKL